MFTPDEKLVIKAAEGGLINSWDMQTGDPVHKIVIPS